ncbi:amidohydrolase [Salirhabdus salicampi]|uniref:amidohydrolase n=1 Tax=Salirhabdus salicampi TaxID=476102 RepID=UPI0020C34510|nr:amidohydrolase [Salirhabdus salicampi]MCP8617127.1 amidohydrolase [Salirhabdus salicampi]
MGKLWYGGTIYTMVKEGHQVDAVYTNNGKILDVGTKKELKHKYAQQIREEVNLNGKVMYPGFTDSHLHIIGHGEKLLRLDLSKATSKKEVLKEIKKISETLEEDEWVIGEGFNENMWQDPTVLHCREIDEVINDRPVVLTRVCRHALIANSKAMELAGVSPTTSSPDGGLIERDDDGELTGYFHDQAQQLIKDAMPSVSDRHIVRAINVAVDDLIQNGLVGGHNEDLNHYGSFERTFKAFQQSINENHKFRAHMLVHHEVVEEMVSLGYEFGQGSQWLRLGAMKIFTDGALGGRTAWLKQPYEDDPATYGVAIHSGDDLETLIKKARRYNMPVAVHAIGDAALEQVVHYITEHPVPQGEKDRLIHGQMLTEEIYEKIAQLPVIIDIQPTFVSSDFPWVIERIGEDRLKHAYPWKSLLQHGIICAGGSDAPIEDINPIKGIDAAVNRVSVHDGKVYGREERLTPFEAVSLYTTGSAAAISKEHEQGKIAPGYVADFTVLSEDLFTVDHKMIKNVTVEMTVIDNTIVFNRENNQG